MNTLHRFILGLPLLLTVATVHAAEVRISPDLESLVQDADLIVEGKIEKVIDSYPFYGYKDYASVLKELDKDAPLKLSVPATDYLIKVNRVLKSPEKSHPVHLVLRMLFQEIPRVEQVNQNIRSEPGRVKKQLLFLKRNPDGSYSAGGPERLMYFGQNANGEHLAYRFEQLEHVLPGTQGLAQDVLTEITRMATQGQ